MFLLLISCIVIVFFFVIVFCCSLSLVNFLVDSLCGCFFLVEAKM